MLNENMVELDDKKALTLEKCFMDVNKHFGALFSSLLPGA
jgi:chromosome segregation ATPase